ncbi:MAG TPA: thioredoxin family protein [Candidatus Didemnitutus sp.]|nr:thioredoxin family protein [Candidatus Didemnitutus sp.]
MKLLATCVVLLGVTLLRAEPEYPKLGPDIYDTKADGSTLVENAIVTANATHRRILLDFGANWCVWCRRLHHTFETDPTVRKALEDNFVVVMIDANNRDGKDRNASLNRYYENPLKEGLPVLVVLEKDGRQLKTQDTALFENGKDGHDPKKIVAFLTEWAPKK